MRKIVIAYGYMVKTEDGMIDQGHATASLSSDGSVDDYFDLTRCIVEQTASDKSVDKKDIVLTFFSILYDKKDEK